MSGVRYVTPLTGDTERQRLAIHRATVMALWVWPAFHAADVGMILVLYPEASYSRYILLRLVPEAVFFVVLALGRQKARPSLLFYAHALSFGLAGAAISFMALQFGGLHSSFMHGLSIVILVRSMLVPTPWPRAALLSSLTIASFPAIMGAAAAFDPRLRAAWASPTALAAFASHYLFVVGSMIVGAASSQLVWNAQQQVYRARKLGRYRLKAPIGKGGMGEVWLAWDDALRRDVVLKLLRGDSTTSSSAVARFEREAQAASQLKCPHTIRIFDFGASDDGIHFIAMEYLEGADLAVLVDSYGPMPPARAARFLGHACLSLSEAHAAGLVHRDVKPQNLYVTRVGEDYDFVKLLDFGVVHVLADNSSLTRTGAILGTPAYMAPELLLGKRADARSDIYSLGATLHYLLTGSTPTTFPDGSLVPPSERLGAPIPEALEAIMERCLERDPARRFQSALELRAALDRYTDLNVWTLSDARLFWLETHRGASAPARTPPPPRA